MPHNNNIIIGDPNKASLKFPQRQILPGAGNLMLDCSNCGGVSFGVHCAATTDGTAQVREIICLGCGKSAKLDDHGYFEKGGKAHNMKGDSL